MSQSYWLEQKIVNTLSSKKNYDYVIVGCGIAGLSTAYWLQQENPTLKIAILEKERLGFGASGRNAGFVTCGSTEHFIKLNQQFGLAKAVEIWKFSEENRKLLIEHVIQDKGDDLDYRQTGSCTVAPSSEHWLKYQEISQTMRQAGIDVTEVSPQHLESDYGVTGFDGGIQYAGDGYIHPVKLLNQLRSKLNADVHEGVTVMSLDKNATEQIIHTDKGVFTASKIILTLNAYLPQVLENFEALIKPGRGQIVLTEPLPVFVKGPCYLTKHLCYFRQLPTGHLLVGGFRNLALDSENTYADETTPLIQNALLHFIQDHFKFGKQAKVAFQWSGVMGFSPDGQMMLGCADNKNIHIMTGCSGHGIGLSFHAARTLVKSIFGQPIPTHLALERFL